MTGRKPGRRPLPVSEKRSNSVNVRFTDEEYADLLQVVPRGGVATWIHKLVVRTVRGME